ncbi:MAG: CBS domain-containing protein, partial [Armatimonadetes bacterium]|nr:CBS domain-containing protein [Armatimonadota bacterium]
IAGPLVNFVLGPLFLLLHRLFEPAAATADPILMLSQPAAICLKLGIVNLFMGVFNLIPAFPMDGGRILRALLARTMPYEQATARAAWLGQLLALVLAVVGLFGPHPMLVFVALFVFMAATEEGARAQTYTLLQGVTVREAMVTRFATLRRGDTLATAVELLLTGAQQDFPVVEQDQVVGVLTRARLLVTLNQSGTELYVSEVMESAPPAVQPETPLEEALEQFSARPEPLIPVVGPEGLCGLLTKENAVEVILVRTALYRNLNSNGH